MKKIQSALISVYHKDNLESLVSLLHHQGVVIYSTGGTQSFIQSLGIPCIAVESVTSYPSILGGRVKTLHPKIFGGILFRRQDDSDLQQIAEYHVPPIDLVIVDLYPFEATVASGANAQDIIEKIDIGGISLIRAAAKNFEDVAIVSSQKQYAWLEETLRAKNGATDLQDRRLLATQAFDTSSHYDTAIYHYFNQSLPDTHRADRLKISESQATVLRYGENPHQKGVFYGNLSALFDQLNGKELSYNNLVDIDAAVALMADFPLEEGKGFAILKHNNACGMAFGSTVQQAYANALKADPVSAFGGVLITNAEVDLPAAEEMHQLFFEVLIAPGFHEDALKLLKGKKNRILLRQKETLMPDILHRTLLNGIISQEKDSKIETSKDLEMVTKRVPSQQEIASLLFANKLAKHTKSNTIVLAKYGQLFASGVGQTSRIDALKQAIHKAKSFGFDLSEAVMASDAFFPFADSVEIAHQAGIKAVIQPGGSIKDQESIDFCDAHGMAMVFTGVRHFKH